MRLLEINGDGVCSLTQDIIDNIPQYAILSHTWGAEEVTFRDMVDDTGKCKAGYDKILFCREMARRYCWKHFWVDTCCIDKSNNTELSEAINSMFRWYRNAAKCYVYLSDVPRVAVDTNVQSNERYWEAAFRQSRWFTRGWTLQELIAPKSVEFFSKDWELLGNKVSLEQNIYEITGIPISALRGSPLSDFSVPGRMLWAERRETTRKEDKAYSLLGIFDVYMPLIYGEGEEHALKRFREMINEHSKGVDSYLLHHLPYTAEAPFNSYAKQDSSTCLANTRVDLLKEIYSWVDSQDERCIFWLNGLAGTGKSTIARTVARRYFEQKRLGASFFFSRGGGDVGHAGKFFTSIAVQLAHSSPPFRRYISEAVEEQIDIASHSLSDQWRQLILRPLLRLDKRLSPSSYLLIVDALDECDNKDHIRIILQLLAEARSSKTVRLRIILTSRPEIPIRHGIYAIPQAEHRDLVLHNIEQTIVDHDIFLYLEYNLGIIGQEWALGLKWPGEEVLRQLALHSSGLFIWAAIACRFVREGRRFAPKRLDSILKVSSSTITAPEKHLNEIYISVLRNSISSNYTDEEKEELNRMLKHILGSIVVLLSPLSTLALSKLLYLQKEDIDQTLEELYTIVDISDDPTNPLRLHHPSFRDFLFSQARCGEFWVDEKTAHQTLVNSCIQLMSNILKKDICEIHIYGKLVTQVASSRIKNLLPPEVQYACLYWVQHLQKSGNQLYDNCQVHRFLQVHFLHWLEALAWMGKTSEGILAILSLEAHVLPKKSSNLRAFIYDAKRFVLYNRPVIEQAPLQLYCSALVFAPEKSVIRRHFKEYIPPWIHSKRKVQASWNAVLHGLEGHLLSVTSVAFSPDGKLVMSGSLDKTLRLWDASTGAALQVLVGHSDVVTSIAFSLDGKMVISGSEDKTVKLWDIITGEAVQTLKGNSDIVTSVAFSLDGKRVMSGSLDQIVLLWDAVTGAIIQTFRNHWSMVKSVAFSTDGKLIVSGSYDRTIKLWDTATGALLRTLEGHWDAVTSVTFSPNGKQVASGSLDNTARLWDSVTGIVLRTLEGHSDWVISVTFSPDGRLVASGSLDNTVRLWNAVTGVPLQAFEGNSNLATLAAFSLDGQLMISELGDKVVRLWGATAEAGEARLQTREGHLESIIAVVFSPDGKLVASGSLDSTIRLWNATTGGALRTLEGHSRPITSVSFSPDGKIIASGSLDKTIRLWDAVTGEKLQKLEGYSEVDSPISFSPDGELIVSELGRGTLVPGTPSDSLDQSDNLLVLNNWIREGSKRILWLPPDYRATCVAVWDRLIVLGHSSGSISFLQIEQGLKLVQSTVSGHQKQHHSEQMMSSEDAAQSQRNSEEDNSVEHLSSQITQSGGTLQAIVSEEGVPTLASTYDSKKETGMVGLKIRGATGYLNIILQSLYFNVAFRQAVHRIPTERDARTDIAWALQRLFNSLQSSSIPVSTQEITDSLGWSTSQLFQQRDVYVMSRNLIETLEKRMKGTSVEHVLSDLFAGVTKTYISCINVDYMEYRAEAFWSISLETCNNRSLDDSFKEYIKVDTYDGENQFFAGTAYGYQDARKGVIFERFPPVLQIDLMRFQYDFNSNALMKVHDYYEFPEEFDAAPYLSADADKSEPWTYLLVSIFVHDGSINGGLYYSFQRPTKDGPFYKFSNDRVTRATMKEALNDNFGGEHANLHDGIDARTIYGKGYPLRASKSASMLFYIRKSRLDDIFAGTTKDDLPEQPTNLNGPTEL